MGMFQSIYEYRHGPVHIYVQINPLDALETASEMDSHLHSCIRFASHEQEASYAYLQEVCTGKGLGWEGSG